MWPSSLYNTHLASWRGGFETPTCAVESTSGGLRSGRERGLSFLRQFLSSCCQRSEGIVFFFLSGAGSCSKLSGLYCWFGNWNTMWSQTEEKVTVKTHVLRIRGPEVWEIVRPLNVWCVNQISLFILDLEPPWFEEFPEDRQLSAKVQSVEWIQVFAQNGISPKAIQATALCSKEHHVN